MKQNEIDARIRVCVVFKFWEEIDTKLKLYRVNRAYSYQSCLIVFKLKKKFVSIRAMIVY